MFNIKTGKKTLKLRAYDNKALLPQHVLISTWNIDSKDLVSWNPI